MSRGARAPIRASWPGGANPRFRVVRWTLLAFAVLIGSLLVPASPLVAQSGTGGGGTATADGASISIEPERSSYEPGERVGFIITNTGTTELRGTYEVHINWKYECDPSADVCPALESVRVDVLNGSDTLAPGESTLVVWDMRDDNGEPAPHGAYYAAIGWFQRSTSDDTQRIEDRSGEFRIAAPVSDGPSPPRITVRAPADGTTYVGDRIPVRVHVADDKALDRVAILVDGDPLVERRSLGARNWTYAQDHAISLGPHTLSVEARDTDGHESTSSVRFQVDTGSGGSLHVATDKFAYRPGENVHITLVNRGNHTLQGEAGGSITGPDGYVVARETLAPDLALAPGERESMTWAQRADDGSPVANGSYTLEVHVGDQQAKTRFHIGDPTTLPLPGEPRPDPQPAPGFRVHLVEPAPGSGHRDQVRLVIEIGEPGADRLLLHATNGDQDLTAKRSFPDPQTGRILHVFDLQSAPAGTYRTTVTAEGPAGVAQATTWFTVYRSSDTEEPRLTLHHPDEDATVDRAFPIVFRAEDDVGIVYAEAFLDDRLIGRQAWDRPVLHGAFAARVPAELAGDGTLKLVVYDLGHHSDIAFRDITVRSTLRPCADLVLEARAAASAAPPSAAPAGGNDAASATGDAPANATVTAADITFACPAPPPAPSSRVSQGPFDYAQREPGIYADLKVRDRQLFDRVRTLAPSVGGEGGSIELDVRGQAMVFRTQGGQQVEYDVNGTWIATQRGGHVVLENTVDGTRVLIALVGGSPGLSGNRLVADLSANAHVVARPIGTSSLEADLADGILEGRVGAEVGLGDDAGDAPVAVSYTDLDVQVRAQGAQRIAATLSSDDHTGRALVFTLGPGHELGAATALEVILDGQRLRAASSLEDVLDPHDDDQLSEYYIVVDPQTGETRVIVSVGHFSTRELVIQAAAVAAPFLTPLAILGGLTVVGAAAFALFRREET